MRINKTLKYAGSLSATTIFYIETENDKGCVSVARVPVEVAVRETALNYPDLRIEVCSNNNTVNLSKYIDTTGSPTVTWTGYSISPAGVIGSIPSYKGTYTYKYTVSNECLSPVTRMAYLHVVTNNKIFFPRDTVSVCWEQAEALQINQLFGIEADGVWSTYPV